MSKAAVPRQVLLYADDQNREPFTEWLESIRNPPDRRRILARLRRLEQGNMGDCKQLPEEIWELRLFFGPGYRIYYGEDGDKIIIILCGGDKNSQRQDIAKAAEYWREYNAQLSNS